MESLQIKTIQDYVLWQEDYLDTEFYKGAIDEFSKTQIPKKYIRRYIKDYIKGRWWVFVHQN